MTDTMYVAVDDTDSVNGNCTTFLATEIIRRLSDLDLIGYPRLVRLNPATPWKTRGNGSLVMRFGKGTGKKTFIGVMDGKKVYCYENQSPEEPSEDDLIKRIAPIIEEYHEDDADPGLVISKTKPSQEFYWNGVRTIMDRSVIENELERIGAKKFEMGCGRGIIGCTCGMAWRPRDRTLELLGYRPKDRWGTERKFDPMTIRETELSVNSTFNSWEERMQKVAMVPATPCPVMYGLRGEDREDLIKGQGIIKTEPLDRWLIFLTNQGTDDHIIRDPDDLVPNQSYYLEGTVTSRCRHIKGGHVFIDMETKKGTVTCAAYEPSKEFRLLFDRLIPGDRIGVMGELREEPRTLNAEKVRIISLTDEIEKSSNPICNVCGRTMESVGKGKGYRCRRCHTASGIPDTRKAVRWVVEGWYEPPTAARRHLSKPLKRMGLEQPVEFVNSRIM
ncbi:MAG: tRNA(Ile)(2)-agmatinylcytidine synthase [Candidatus Methanoplasma sp.]|jgi:tRNA(Ile2)-agmatinylcytidine synthase|nr:tRNA(Ile)(2)-agmatinylcytidine synthase [Candidatus Methanoplasma sp.]